MAATHQEHGPECFALQNKYGHAKAPYDHHKENQEVKAILKHHHEDLVPFQGGMGGIWAPLFGTDMLVCIVVKTPIATDVDKLKHPEVIQHIRE